MKYRANPVIVDAFKIVSIMGGQNEPNVGPTYSLELDSGSIVTATAEMCARMSPTVGDYWVIQSDGYIYLNPKDVFERKYSPVSETQSAR